MSELRCYEYVPFAYARVRDALRGDAAGIFQRATLSASTRADELMANLRVGVGALAVGVDVKIEIHSIAEEVGARQEPATRIEIGWTAARGAGLFPAMSATLSVYPLSGSETQLDLHGVYRPPLGLLGAAIDAAVGHRIAEASVLRFVQDVAARLSAELRA